MGNIKLIAVDQSRLLHVATILRDNKIDTEAIKIIQDAAARSPDSFDIWALWVSIPTAAPNDVTYAKSQMKRLDPLNPDLK